jgi:hypothetical protein
MGMVKMHKWVIGLLHSFAELILCKLTKYKILGVMLHKKQLWICRFSQKVQRELYFRVDLWYYFSSVKELKVQYFLVPHFGTKSAEKFFRRGDFQT